MYIIEASIEGGFDDIDVVCAFDPTKVVVRLRREFPDLLVDPKDYAWKDYKLFRRMGLTKNDGALGVAIRDARRRGPIWLFRVPNVGGTTIRGQAERHSISFQSDEPFPEPLRSQLIRFVEGLRFAPCVVTKCVRLEGNDEYPA